MKQKEEVSNIEDLFKPAQKVKKDCHYSSMIAGLFDRNYKPLEQTTLKNHIEECKYCFEQYTEHLKREEKMKSFIPSSPANKEWIANLKGEISEVVNNTFSKKISKRIQNASNNVAQSSLKKILMALF